jgi:uncharacterized protein (TIGR02466 family)
MAKVKKAKVETKVQPVAEPQMNAFAYFPSLVYTIEEPKFLNIAKKVAKEHLNEARKNMNGQLNQLYPVVMSNTFQHDGRVAELVHYIAQSGWNILDSQGYDMQQFNVYVQDFWAQEHHKHSHNEEHIHPFGAQLTGFYILECPEYCSNIVFHDPRPAKKQINLPEKNMGEITPGSIAVNFEAKPGMFMFSNAWLPHAFGRHGSDKPFIFIHFNLNIVHVSQLQHNHNICQPIAEVI